MHDTHVLHKAEARYISGAGEKINHLLFMDGFKLHGKNESGIKGLVSLQRSLIKT